MLRDWFEDRRIAVATFADTIAGATVEKYQEEILSNERGNLRIRIRMLSGSLLEINEAVQVKSNKIELLDYRHHLQREENQIVFRYDNAPHFRNGVPPFDHKHTSAETMSCLLPRFEAVLNEAGAFIHENS
jgi:hypothetical protein